MHDNGYRERDMWTPERQEQADLYAKENGIGFHNFQALKTKKANKAKTRLLNKKKKQSRKNNRKGRR